MAFDDDACSAQAAGWAGSRQLASLPRDEALRTARYYVEGLLKQLNAMPLEIRVAAFCHAECPGLRPMQAALFDAQLRELSSVFAPAIRERAPVEVFDRNVSMNAALAGQWARLSGNPLVWDAIHPPASGSASACWRSGNRKTPTASSPR